MATPYALRASVAERRTRILQLRVAGVPIAAIAQEIGLSESAVRVDVARALASRVKELDEAVQEYRAVELERLEALERAGWTALRRTHYVVPATGKVARHPETMEPLLDDAPTLAAINTLLRIQERRARLLGLDAVARVTTTIDNSPVADIEREIARLFAAMIASTQNPVPAP